MAFAQRARSGSSEIERRGSIFERRRNSFRGWTRSFSDRVRGFQRGTMNLIWKHRRLTRLAGKTLGSPGVIVRSDDLLNTVRVC